MSQDLLILSKHTMDIFLKDKNPDELIALYMFYYNTAKWQKTNQPHCTTSYVSKGLHWYDKKVKRNKKKLIKLGLIQDVKNIDKETKRIKGWYIKINYLWKKETVKKYLKSHPSGFPPSGRSHPVVDLPPNSLSSGSINSSNAGSLNANKNTPCFPCKTYTRLVKNYKGNSVIKTWCKLFKPMCDKDDKFCMAHCNQLYVRLQTEFKSKGLDIKSPAFFGAFRNKVNQMLGDPDSNIFKELKNRYKKMPSFIEEVFNESNR